MSKGQTNMTIKEYFNKLTLVALSTVIVATVSVGLYAIGKIIQADGKVQYCYVESLGWAPGNLRLVGHRPWRIDREIGRYSTAKEAVDAANLLNCPLDK